MLIILKNIFSMNTKVLIKIILPLTILGILATSYFSQIYTQNSASISPQTNSKINSSNSSQITSQNSNNLQTSQNKNLKLMFAGDIFFARRLDEWAKKSELKENYIVSKLDTLKRENYDAWIGNLECPVTTKQSSLQEQSTLLKFSCSPTYLPALRKYFDVLSLSNNHTDNMNGKEGLLETEQFLQKENFQYFGTFDNTDKAKLCKIVDIKQVKIAMCGFHGVFNLPTKDQIAVVSQYSKYFPTIVMPHQGVEYKFTSNKYQQAIYRDFIDNGADLVVGAHPHVVQESEVYKGKLIMYSLGNFIFDQASKDTNEHIVLDVDMQIQDFVAIDCKENCLELKPKKPKIIWKYGIKATKSSVGVTELAPELQQKMLERTKIPKNGLTLQ